MPIQSAPVEHVNPFSFLNLFPKQFEVLNVGISPPGPGELDIKPRVLVSGGRMTGKTIAICERIMRHLWETPGARAAVFAKTVKVAKDGGIWEDIMDAARKWVDAGICGQHGQPFEFTTKNSQGEPGPKVDSQTRTISFKIRNYWGGESELKLFSLEHDHEVEAKVKSTRFSLMWFSELSLYTDPKVMNVSYRQLRMKHLKPWQHLWIADTNPHEDGEDCWIYKVWYKQRIQDEASMREEMSKKKGSLAILVDPQRLKQAEIAKRHPLNQEEIADLIVKQKLEYRKSLKLIEIFLDDNIFLAPGDRLSLIEDYEDDPGEYARNVDGRWVKGHGIIGKHFADLFNVGIHVVGSTDPNVGDSILLSPDTIELFTGWDIGDVNHSFHILEKRLNNDGKPDWCGIDDLVTIREEISVVDFTLMALEKMDAIERKYGRQFIWNHWSDSSATDVWKSSGEGGTQAMEVESASGGRIQLQGAIKPGGSVRSRVRMLRYLLRRERIFFGLCCHDTIEMLYHCARGTKESEYVMENRYKHPFDSLTYPIYMETLRDPDSIYMMSNKPKPARGGVIYVSG